MTGDATDETDKARRIFYYARDNVRFALLGSGFEITASKTARIGYGDCGSKTNFHLALLRAAGIPARARGIMAEMAALKGLIPGFMYALSQRFYKEDFHFWAECYLSGRWIACEGLLDRELYLGALRKGLFTTEQIPSIDWDGESDLVLLEPWKTEDLGHRPNWDEWSVEFKQRMRTPKAVDKLMELCLAPLCRRQTDQVRKLA